MEDLTAQISRHARGEEPARRHGQRAAEVDHAREGAAVEDVEAVLCISLGSAIVIFANWKREACWERTYGVLFLDVELEVDGAGAGGCYAELWRRSISLVMRA